MSLLDDIVEIIKSGKADGFTPLGLASFFGKTAMVEFLLIKGANPNVAANNAFKVTPIHSASEISNINIVKVLIAHGADVNAKQMKGVTPLHSSAHNGQKPLAMTEEKEFSETVELLTALGAK